MKLPEDVDQPAAFSLTPYTGPWTKNEAAHLLRRTMFGATFQQINQAVTDGLAGTITKLMTAPTPTQPLAFLPEEAVVANGQTWVNAFYPATNAQQTDGARQASLMAWFMQRLNQNDVSIQEKICLFWENHFGIEGTFDAKATYNLHNLFRTKGLGNFKQLVKDVTIDPNMLVFLNGASNNKFSPNENYARELLELFTVGKGDQIAVGDYSNYTEADIAQSAKILTGWSIENFLSSTAQPKATYFPQLHDASLKTLSSYFGNTTISNADNLEYANYIDVVFQQPNMAKYVCRKLYRWFVNYDLTQAVEDTIIADMATMLKNGGFEVAPVIEALLKSEHFYDLAVRGAIIKNPLELIFSMFNPTTAKPAHSHTVNYKLYQQMYYFGNALGMDYLRPPSVGGWPAYYQAPSYTKLWANSSYIKLRFDIAAYVTIYGGFDVDGNKFKVDALTLVNGLSMPSDPVKVIDDLALLYAPKGLTAAQKSILKGILTNGQPDFEWTTEYNEYLAAPTDPAKYGPVTQRVEFVLYRMFQSPEFQTI